MIGWGVSPTLSSLLLDHSDCSATCDLLRDQLVGFLFADLADGRAVDFDPRVPLLQPRFQVGPGFELFPMILLVDDERTLCVVHVVFTIPQDSDGGFEGVDHVLLLVELLEVVDGLDQLPGQEVDFAPGVLEVLVAILGVGGSDHVAVVEEVFQQLTQEVEGEVHGWLLVMG